MFFLFKVSKKDGFPSKISTKLKEMKLATIYSKHSTARRFTHTICCWLSSHSVKAVVSTGQFGDKKHSSWQFVLQLQFVLWEYLTPFPEISAFGSELRRLGWSLGALPGTGWCSWGSRQVLAPCGNNGIPLLSQAFTQKSSSL